MSKKLLSASLILGLSLILFGSLLFFRDYHTSLDNPLVKDKMEPWLWDKLELLEANGTTRFYSIIVDINCEGLNRSEGYEYRKEKASLLERNHNATITNVGKVLSFINLKVRVPEIKKIALYDFVGLIGDGEAKGTAAIHAFQR